MWEKNNVNYTFNLAFVSLILWQGRGYALGLFVGSSCPLITVYCTVLQ